MRSDQFIGLNDWASTELEKSRVDVVERGTRTFPDGSVEQFERIATLDTKKTEKCGSYYGMFWDEYHLSKYTMPDGTVYEEFLQASPWHSGPMFFIALKDADGNEIEESLWSEEEMESY